MNNPWKKWYISEIYSDVEFNDWGSEVIEEGSDREKQANDLEDRYHAALKAFEEDTAELEKVYDAAYVAYRDGLVAAAEKHGVPTSFDHARYVPASMKDIFGDGNRVDPYLVCDIRQTGGTYEGYDRESIVPPGKWWSPSTC